MSYFDPHELASTTSCKRDQAHGMRIHPKFERRPVLLTISCLHCTVLCMETFWDGFIAKSKFYHIQACIEGRVTV